MCLSAAKASGRHSARLIAFTEGLLGPAGGAIACLKASPAPCCGRQPRTLALQLMLKTTHTHTPQSLACCILCLPAGDRSARVCLLLTAHTRMQFKLNLAACTDLKPEPQLFDDTSATALSEPDNHLVISHQPSPYPPAEEALASMVAPHVSCDQPPHLPSWPKFVSVRGALHRQSRHPGLTAG